jgi:plastocyanin
MTRLVRLEIAAVVIVALALLSFSRARGAPATKPVTHRVAIEGMQFRPEVVSVSRGDSIVWTNNDLFPHTVTAKSGAFDSHEIKPGESWTYRAAKASELDYVCSLHPTMKAVLRVR